MHRPEDSNRSSVRELSFKAARELWSACVCCIFEFVNFNYVCVVYFDLLVKLGKGVSSQERTAQVAKSNSFVTALRPRRLGLITVEELVVRVLTRVGNPLLFVGVFNIFIYYLVNSCS